MIARKSMMFMTGAALIIFALSVWGVMSQLNRSSEEPNEAYTGHGGTFKNPLIDMDTPDPSIVYDSGYYYMTFTHNGTDIMVMKSRTLDFREAERKVVWYPPIGTMYSANLWAPEIQRIQGKWYIYFAADDGANENHRMYALQADTDNPLGSYTFQGQVTDETNKWAIDGLVLEHNDRLYFIWSGWEGDVNIQQNTYIAPMSDPLTISGPRVLLSEPDLDWEKAGGPPYINEGQAILKKDGNVHLVYSGAGSWTPFYSLGMLTLQADADPLVASNWRKSEQPLLQMDEEAGVYGPGHNTFVTSPDGTEDWIVYHATSGLHDGWNNRKARAQKITWSKEGMPIFGAPLSLDTAIPVPSGTGVFRAEHAAFNGGTLEFDLIPSAVEQAAPLLIHYRNEAAQPRVVRLFLNGEKAGEVELPSTTEGEQGYAYTSIPLQAGNNTIGLGIGTDGAVIEAIELPRYEAEASEVLSPYAWEENLFASGGGIVEAVPSEEGAVRFHNISVPRSGTYQMVMAVSNPSPDPLEITAEVNGRGIRLKVPSTERNQYQEMRWESRLNSGLNAFTLKDAAGLLHIDYVDIVQ